MKENKKEFDALSEEIEVKVSEVEENVDLNQNMKAPMPVFIQRVVEFQKEELSNVEKSFRKNSSFFLWLGGLLVSVDLLVFLQKEEMIPLALALGFGMDFFFRLFGISKRVLKRRCYLAGKLSETILLVISSVKRNENITNL